MSIAMRPELSIKNKYYVEKHRYYELKHFCLQYPDWKRSYTNADGLGNYDKDQVIFSRSNIPGDPTSRIVEERLRYLKRMELVEQTAVETDPELASYILRGVTEALSYTTLKSRLEIPCGRETYYDRYRRFFWILNKRRD